MNSIWQTFKFALGAGSTSSGARRRAARASARVRAHASPYRACSLEPGQDACAAVTRLQNNRFLQTEAPKLPLPGCGRLQCDCRYRRHRDRRHMDHDRRLLGAIATQTYPLMEEERRYAYGRRVDDDCTGDDILFS